MEINSLSKQEQLDLAKKIIKALELQNLELKQELTTLICTQDNLGLLVKHIPFNIFRVSTEGKIIHVSGNGLKSLFPESHDLVGKDIYSTFNNNLQLTTQIKRALRGETFSEILYFGEYCLELWFSPVFNTKNRVGTINLFVNDITERKKLEVDLEKFQYYSEKSFQIGKLGFWEVDIESNNIFWSKSVFTLYGLSENSYKPEISHFNPDNSDDVLRISKSDRNRLWQNLKNCIENGEPYSVEYEIRKSDGSTGYLSLHAESISDSQGKPKKIFGIIQDISELKGKELEISEAHAQLSTILESINNAFFAIDKDWKVTYLNSPGEMLINLPSKAALGKTIWEIWPNEMGSEFYLYCQWTMAARNTVKLEKYFENSKTWYEVNIYPTINGISVIFSNISERKEIELTLKTLNESKTKFFSIIAHDLRSPINSLVGFTNIAAQSELNFSKEEMQTYMKDLNLSVRNIYKLLDNLLIWANLQMNMLEVNAEVHNLNEMVEFNIQLNNTLANQKNISIVSELSQPVHFLGDKNMIDSVLRNLISNAVKFTSKGGNVCLSARELDNVVEISVSDSGVGIENSIINSLFKLDVKHSTKGTDGEAGTGLGLKLSKELVEKNGGIIGVESTPGKGSRFFFTLPKAENKAAEA
jgi:PAS domain S-box-containing protein